jgi:mRNA interferase RelE/StbE
MGAYKISFKKSALKELGAIPKKDLKRILAAIEALSENPRPPQSRKLCAAEKYRLRQGVYRVLYTIEDDRLVVCVVRVAHRREAYR